jgi:hypothetical protein
MKYSGIILASAVLTIGLSAGSPVADAKVITSYAPAKIAGQATCAAKYPAGRGQRAAFPHQLTMNCYSSPWRKAGFNDINGQRICDKALHDEAIAICDGARFKGGAAEKHACLAAARAYMVGVGVGATVLRAYQNGQKWIADKQCSVKRR